MEPTIRVPFSSEQQQWYDTACAKINPERLKQLLFKLTDIHSPTGAAGAASQFMARHFAGVGLRATYDAMTAQSVMCSANSADLVAFERAILPYVPIDTHLEGR